MRQERYKDDQLTLECSRCRRYLPAFRVQPSAGDASRLLELVRVT
jgi:hypothetical protein